MTLMSHCYGYGGWVEFWGALLCYYVIANDFDFPPSSLQFIANAELVVPNESDVYNPTSPTLGNSNLSLTSCNNKS